MAFPRYVRDHEGTLWELSSDVWTHIVVRHPEITHLLDHVEETLRDPDEVRRSRKRHDTVLYYKHFAVLRLGQGVVRNKYACVVADQSEREIKTAYLTTRLKQGARLWRKG